MKLYQAHSIGLRLQPARKLASLIAMIKITEIKIPTD